MDGVLQACAYRRLLLDHWFSLLHVNGDAHAKAMMKA
jgi:hypothetical protein